MRRAAGTEQGELAAEFLEYLLEQIGSEEVSVWDGVAAVDLCDSSLCTARQVRIDVLTEPGREEGRTVAKRDGQRTCRLCRRPKTERIKAYLGESLSREQAGAHPSLSKHKPGCQTGWCQDDTAGRETDLSAL